MNNTCYQVSKFALIYIKLFFKCIVKKKLRFENCNCVYIWNSNIGFKNSKYALKPLKLKKNEWHGFKIKKYIKKYNIINITWNVLFSFKTNETIYDNTSIPQQALENNAHQNLSTSLNFTSVFEYPDIFFIYLLIDRFFLFIWLIFYFL